METRDGRSWTTIVRPSQAWVEIAPAQGKLAVAMGYIAHGIRHIALGADHLLFLLGLLLIVKDRWMLLETVTAFTVTHSITLAIATLGYANAPVVPLNAAIALSILFLGPEIVRSWRGETSFTIEHPWVVAFAFGLIHGFGFARALVSAGLPRSELPLALVSVNVGVEIGQLGFILLALERSFRVLEVRWPHWVEAHADTPWARWALFGPCSALRFCWGVPDEQGETADLPEVGNNKSRSLYRPGGIRDDRAGAFSSAC